MDEDGYQTFTWSDDGVDEDIGATDTNGDDSGSQGSPFVFSL